MPNWRETTITFASIGAHRWLDGLLERLDLQAWTQAWSQRRRWVVPDAWSDEQVRAGVLADVEREAPTMQIAILKACLERMPFYREQFSLKSGLQEDQFAGYAAGTLLYGIACYLYSRKLAYSEQDVDATR